MLLGKFSAKLEGWELKVWELEVWEWGLAGNGIYGTRTLLRLSIWRQCRATNSEQNNPRNASDCDSFQCRERK